jgi:hypothetical protein
MGLSRSCYNFFYLGPGCCMWIMSAVTQQNLLLTGKLTLKTSCTHPSQFFFCGAAGVIAGDGGVLLCAGAAEPSFTLPNWVCNVPLFLSSHIHLLACTKRTLKEWSVLVVGFRFKLLVRKKAKRWNNFPWIFIPAKCIAKKIACLARNEFLY